MALYRIDIGNGTDINTVYPDVGWKFNKNLNQINEAELKFSGTGEFKRSLISIGNSIIIYKDGIIVFIGLIDNTDYFVGGTVVFHASGLEVWLAKEPGTYAGSPWTATASATILSEIIAESTYLNAGTIEAGFSMDYRLVTSQSLWNGISNLAKKTSQDVSIDYTASPVEISILNHVGSSTSVAVLNEGKECTNLRKSEGYPRGNKIEIFGKGDGINQIKGSAEDATSISTYGTIKKSIVDSSIMTIDEANRLAAAELALNKDPPQIYDFDLTNPDYGTLNLGDHITLNALDQDVINEEVRIVGIEEGDITGKQYITLQVTNPSLKTLMKTRNKVMAQIMKEQIDNQTYMQGSGNTNTWGAGINAKTSYPLKIGFFLPVGYIQDEAGNLNVKELTVSYDLDKYRSDIGTASFTGSDPQVQNDSGNTEPDVANNSGSIGADVANLSGTEGASVTGTSASSGAATWSTSYSGTSGSVGSGTLTTSWATMTNTGVIGLSSDLVFYYITFKNTNGIYNRTINVRANMNGVYYPHSGGTYTNVDPGEYVTIPILMPVDVVAQDIRVEAKVTSSTMGYEFTWNWQAIGKHTHADGSYAAANHLHNSGTYAAASHLHSDGSYVAADHGHPDGSYDIDAADIDHISVGDDVSESGLVNASSVNLYLDFWNGSAWINKHSILGTGLTIDSDVDMTNGNTYPDVSGYWRIRVEPITGTADFAQGIVKLRNAVDN